MGGVRVAGVLEAGNRAEVGWAAGVMEKSQGFGYDGWLVAGGGGGSGTGVVEEDLSIPVPRVKANTVSPSGMWLLFNNALLQLWLLGPGCIPGWSVLC